MHLDHELGKALTIKLNERERDLLTFGDQIVSVMGLAGLHTEVRIDWVLLPELDGPSAKVLDADLWLEVAEADAELASDKQSGEVITKIGREAMSDDASGDKLLHYFGPDGDITVVAE